jgi:hypothetical protein
MSQQLKRNDSRFSEHHKSRPAAVKECEGEEVAPISGGLDLPTQSFLALGGPVKPAHGERGGEKSFPIATM